MPSRNLIITISPPDGADPRIRPASLEAPLDADPRWTLNEVWKMAGFAEVFGPLSPGDNRNGAKPPEYRIAMALEQLAALTNRSVLLAEADMEERRQQRARMDAHLERSTAAAEAMAAGESARAAFLRSVAPLAGEPAPEQPTEPCTAGITEEEIDQLIGEPARGSDDDGRAPASRPATAPAESSPLRAGAQ